MGPFQMAMFGIVGILAFFVLFAIIWASRVQTAGPNEVLIISGRFRTEIDESGKPRQIGFRHVRGGRAFIYPIVEKCERLSLELMTLEISTPEVVTKKGVPIMVDGVAQIKVRSDDVSIMTAAEQFLGKSKSEIMNIAHQTMEGHLRAILGTMKVEELIDSRDVFASQVQDVSSPDLAKMGLTIVSFTIKDIRDKQGYLDSLGKSAIAEAQRNAAIGQSEAQSDAEIKRAAAAAASVEEASKSNKHAQVGKLSNDTQIAEADRDFNIKKAEYEASVNAKRADADQAYDLQRFKNAQAVRREEMQVSVVAKEKEIEIQQQEIQRKQYELTAMVERPAEAERKKVELLAQAEQFKLKATAEGEAESQRMRGLARADVERAEGTANAEIVKAKGLAEAEVIRAKAVAQAEGVRAMGLSEAETRRAVGLAEAEAMEKKALAWRSYNDAAVAQMFIDKLPEIVRAVSEPLAKTDKIVMISQGGGDGIGPAKISKEIIDVVTQVPPMLEALTGVDLNSLVNSIKKDSAELGKESAAGSAAADDPEVIITRKTTGSRKDGK